VQAARKGDKKARKWLKGMWAEEDVAHVLAVDEAELPVAVQSL